MIGRITSNQIYSGSQDAMQSAKARLSVLQQQSSSGQRITKPSDDPTGTQQALRVRGELAAAQQYGTNITDGTAWLSTADSALTNSENLVRKAKDLLIQAGNSTNGDSGRAAIASQLQGIRDDLLAQANTKYLGRSVFAGTSDAANAFAADGTYNGVLVNGAAPAVTRQVTPQTSVDVSADGAAAFGVPGANGAAGTSVFAALDSAITALRSGTYATDTSSTGPAAQITAGISAMQSSLDRLTAEHANVGSDYAHLESVKTQNADSVLALQKQRSAIETVDTTQVLLDLKTQELAYQTSLQVTASVLQPTLMSFLS